MLVTFEDIFGPSNGLQSETFSVLFKGPQTAGTPLSLNMVQDADLVSFGGKGVGVLVSKAAQTASLLPGGQFSVDRNLIGIIGGNENPTVNCNVSFKVGDSLFIDSLGGMGTSEYVNFVFRPKTPPTTTVGSGGPT